MLAIAEREMLLGCADVCSNEELMNTVGFYVSVRTFLLSGIATFAATEPTTGCSKNAAKIMINGQHSPLIIHGPHGYSPHRAGKATAFHHVGISQNIGDVSVHAKKRTLTLNLFFGHGEESTQSIERKLSGWLFDNEKTRRKGVLKEVSSDSDLSQLIAGVIEWRKIWFS